MSDPSRQDEVGFVTKVKRYLMTIEGLPSARVNDVLIARSGQRAIVRALFDTHITALALSGTPQPGTRYGYLEGGHTYYCGDELFGRIIDPLGVPVDGKGSLPPSTVPMRLEADAPGIEVRKLIHEQLYTGITLVDTLIPIAKGQRQLLFGPMHSGKSTFLTETILAQQAQGTVCIYAVIGKPVVGLRKVTDTILKTGTVSKTVVVAALSDTPPPLIALAPSIAFMLAEEFQARGEHVLVILDDLDSHAKYLREMSLLEGRLPSTESYPGDIFYQHAHLMERSGHFTEAIGGGSITTLPVIQTEFKNFSDLIPTNLMACTDGHLAFLPTLRAEGMYPSISLEQSVTRVGRQAQYALQKEMTTKVQIILGAYRQQREYAQFSTELTEEARALLRQGEIIEILLRQDPYHGIASSTQVLMLALAFTTFFDGLSQETIEAKRSHIVECIGRAPEVASFRSAATTETDLKTYIASIDSAVMTFRHVCQL
ncbi:hypothetical protein K2Q16_02990 [Patescibacteria group bacterium]|nr:hypothetical protein [Patescibacteria group bacterium]